MSQQNLYTWSTQNSETKMGRRLFTSLYFVSRHFFTFSWPNHNPSPNPNTNPDPHPNSAAVTYLKIKGREIKFCVEICPVPTKIRNFQMYEPVLQCGIEWGKDWDVDLSTVGSCRVLIKSICGSRLSPRRDLTWGLSVERKLDYLSQDLEKVYQEPYQLCLK